MAKNLSKTCLALWQESIKALPEKSNGECIFNHVSVVRAELLF